LEYPKAEQPNTATPYLLAIYANIAIQESVAYFSSRPFQLELNLFLNSLLDLETKSVAFLPQFVIDISGK
jgi:hypothetical protein